MNDPVIAVVVVTYNRCSLLQRCLLAIIEQTRSPNRILVVDNASTDGTTEWLSSWLSSHSKIVDVLTLDQNTGGAGGFSAGLHHAINSGADWVWMMDDDAEPAPRALSALVDALGVGTAIYGSIATPGDGSLCWPLFSTDNQEFNTLCSVPQQVEVTALPFLGILIPREVVESIGLPDAGYFIAGDDTEYCFRAREGGIPIIAVGGSHLNHPASEYYRFGFGAFAPVCFRITPWKRYYDVRNRILTSSKRGAAHVWVRTLPATALRLVATLIHEPNRWQQLKAYAVGTVDGLRGLKGQRHLRWGLGT